MFVAHVERVARTVAAQGGSTTAVQAAWLHGVPSTGIDARDLLTRGVPARVVEIVGVLQQRPDEYPASLTDLLLHHRRATLVRYAILTDWHHYLAGQHQYEYVRDQHIRVADHLGLPRPAAKPTPPGIDTRELAGWRPTGNQHWGPIARQLETARAPQALPALLAAYQEAADAQIRGCCRNAIYTIATTPHGIPDEQLLDLSQRWWASTDGWEEQVAVMTRAATGTPADRAALLRKLAAEHQGVVVAAIKALAGPGDPVEIAALHRIIVKPDPMWRWAQNAAATRLIQIGGPDATNALDQRYLNPVDPPWRADPDWLRRNGTTMIPVLIDKLTDPAWQFEAPYALGQLRATPAVGPLCDALAKTEYGVSHIEALGKIGSPDAVPALLDQTRHAHHDIRDHALRALDRAGDPRVVDAAIAGCDDPHPVVRDRAARVLARHADERAVLQLIRLCDGPHADRAAEALARCADPRALPTLWHLFRTAPDRKTRHAAGRGLARIEGPREYLHHANIRVRRAYIWLLGHKPEWHPIDTLQRAVTDIDPIMRARAAEALARLGEPTSAEQIRGLLDDPDPRVRATVATALSRLAGHQARNELVAFTSDPHPAVRAAVTAALKRIEKSHDKPTSP